MEHPDVQLRRLRRAALRPDNAVAQRYVWTTATQPAATLWGCEAAISVIVDWAKEGKLVQEAAARELTAAILAVPVQQASILLKALPDVVGKDASVASVEIAWQRPDLVPALLPAVPSAEPFLRTLACAPERKLREQFPFAVLSLADQENEYTANVVALYFRCLEPWQAPGALAVLDMMAKHHASFPREQTTTYLLEFVLMAAQRGGYETLVDRATTVALQFSPDGHAALLSAVAAAMLSAVPASHVVQEASLALAERGGPDPLLLLPLTVALSMMGPGSMRPRALSLLHASRTTASRALTAATDEHTPRLALVTGLLTLAYSSSIEWLQSVLNRVPESSSITAMPLLFPAIGALCASSDGTVASKAIATLGHVVKNDASNAVLLSLFAEQTSGVALAEMMTSLPLFAAGPASTVLVLRILRSFSGHSFLGPIVMRVLADMVATRSEAFSLLYAQLHDALCNERSPRHLRLIAARTVHHLIADEITANVDPLLAVVVERVPIEKDEFVRAALVDTLTAFCSAGIISPLAIWRRVLVPASVQNDFRPHVRSATCALLSLLVDDTAPLAQMAEAGQPTTREQNAILNERIAALTLLIEAAGQPGGSAAIAALAGVTRKEEDPVSGFLVERLVLDPLRVLAQVLTSSSPDDHFEAAATSFLRSAAHLEASQVRRGPATAASSKLRAPVAVAAADPVSVAAESHLIAVAKSASSAAVRFAALGGALRVRGIAATGDAVRQAIDEQVAVDGPSEGWAMYDACCGWSALMKRAVASLPDIEALAEAHIEMVGRRGAAPGRKSTACFAAAGLADAVVRDREAPLRSIAERIVDALLDAAESGTGSSPAALVAAAHASSSLQAGDQVRPARLTAVLERMLRSTDDEEERGAAAVAFGTAFSRLALPVSLLVEHRVEMVQELLDHWLGVALCDKPLVETVTWNEEDARTAFAKGPKALLSYVRPIGVAVFSGVAPSSDLVKHIADLSSQVDEREMHSVAIAVRVLHAAVLASAGDADAARPFVTEWLAVAQSDVPVWRRQAALAGASVLLRGGPLPAPRRAIQVNIEESDQTLARILYATSDVRSLRIVASMIGKSQSTAPVPAADAPAVNTKATLVATIADALGSAPRTPLQQSVLLRVLQRAAPKYVAACGASLAKAATAALADASVIDAAIDFLLAFANVSDQVAAVLQHVVQHQRPVPLRLLQRVDALVACTPSGSALTDRLAVLVDAAAASEDALVGLSSGLAKAWTASKKERAGSALVVAAPALREATMAVAARLSSPRVAEQFAALLIASSTDAVTLPRLPSPAFECIVAWGLRQQGKIDASAFWDSIARFCADENATHADDVVQHIVASLRASDLPGVLDLAVRLTGSAADRLSRIFYLALANLCFVPASLVDNGATASVLALGHVDNTSGLLKRMDASSAFLRWRRALLLESSDRSAAWAAGRKEWERLVAH